VQLKKENTMWCVGGGFTKEATNKEFTQGGIAVSGEGYRVKNVGLLNKGALGRRRRS